MAPLSTAGWIVHDVGLATNIGGQVFGMVALEPAVMIEGGVPGRKDGVIAAGAGPGADCPVGTGPHCTRGTPLPTLAVQRVGAGT